VWDDIDVEATDSFSADAGDSIAIQTMGTLHIDHVEAGGDVRLLAGGEITDLDIDSTAAIAASGDLILSSGVAIEGNVGASPFRIQLSRTSDLSADAPGEIDIEQVTDDATIRGSFQEIDDLHISRVTGGGEVKIEVTERDMYVGKVISSTSVDLIAYQDILDAFDDADAPGVNIFTGDASNPGDVYLEAGRYIGSASNFLDVEIRVGDLSSLSEDDTFVHSKGSLNVKDVTSTSGDVTLDIDGAAYVDKITAEVGTVLVNAEDEIIDRLNTSASNIDALNVNLISQNAFIGSLANRFDINSSYSGDGSVFADTKDQIFIEETAGDMRIGFVTSTSADVNLWARNASIVDDDADSSIDIDASDALLFAAIGIGQADNPLETTVDNLEAAATTGGIWIDNTGGLVIGGILTTLGTTTTGLSAKGDIVVRAFSPHTVTEDVVSTTGDITLTAEDKLAGGDNFTVTNDATVWAKAGSVTLKAGDNFRQDSGTDMIAATSITILGDSGNADPGVGSTIRINGAVNAPDIYIRGEADNDVVILSILDYPNDALRGHTQVFGGEGRDRITVNRMHTRTEDLDLDGKIDTIDLDGEGNRDLYYINTRGENTTETIRAYDNGASGVDEVIIRGTAESDVFLLRAMALPDQTTPDTGFVAKLNQNGTAVERFNYRGIEGITLNTLYGDDYVAADDALAVFTINGGVGDDRFQIGQVFKSQRDDNTETANIAEDDVFATIEITRGWLSNGISAPMTINGGAGDDEFTVFHNKAVLTLNGGDGDDMFTVRAFALAGSTDSERARTDMKGDGGADTIRYALNAPVGIDGGDGLDTVIIIGTEFSDDFVVTDHGVFGAGLNVTYVNIEKLRVDGAEGDDRFFVLSTDADVITEIAGGLGSDSFFVGGSPSDAPIPVISRELTGYSGVILHDVESEDALYEGIPVDAISANVADNEVPYIVVRESGGVSVVTEDIPASTAGLTEEGWDYDTYAVVLTREPKDDEEVVISVLAQQPAPEDEAKGFKTIEFWDPVALKWDAALQLKFDKDNWMSAQEVRFRAITDTASEGKQFAIINHTVESLKPGGTPGSYHQMPVRSIKVHINDDDRAGAIVTPTGRMTQVIEGGMTDEYAVVLTRAPSANVTVTLDPFYSQVTLSGLSLTWNDTAKTGTLAFNGLNYNQAQLVFVTALDDTLKEGFHTDYVYHTLASADVDQTILQPLYQLDGDPTVDDVNDIPEEMPLDTLLLQHKPIAGSVHVYVDGDERLSSRFEVIGNTLVFLDDSVPQVPEPISGRVEVRYNYLKPGYDGPISDRVVAQIGDNEVAGVFVIESDGSTDVIEGGLTDTYQVVLTREPTQEVTINVRPTETRTTGIDPGTGEPFAYFEKQVLVSGLDAMTLTFTTLNWDTPQTVTVSAIDDSYFDGNDTKVFVPGLATANRIRGPLFVEGAASGGTLTLPAPLMLPGEKNVRPTVGDVVSFDANPGGGGGATEHMKVATADLMTYLDLVAGNEAQIPEKLKDLTLEMTKGPGTGVVLDPENPDYFFDRFWLITDAVVNGPNATLTLQNPSQVDPGEPAVTAPNSTSSYAIANLSINFFADEREQVDYMFVYDQDSVADDTGFMTSEVFGTGDKAVRKGRITGLGMGPDPYIGESTQPGGITYGDIEVVQVNLGSGNDNLTVDYTTISSDHTTKREQLFYTLTMVNTGEGDDEVTVNLTEGEDGAFSLNTQAGDDRVYGQGSTLPLVVFGWTGEDEVHGGSGNDILFGDIGRVDYVDADGFVVTRLGHTWDQNPVNPPISSATNTSLTDTTASFPTTYEGLVGLSVQAISPEGTVQYRTIIANTAAEITIDREWDITPDDTYFYRVSMLPEDQTDGVFRGPRVVWSINDSIGGDDTIYGNEGADTIIGGAAGDTIYGGTENDIVTGDGGRLDLSPITGDDGFTKLDLLQTTALGVGGSDTISGNAGTDIIMGGAAGDTIYGDDDASSAGVEDLGDFILGDNGEVIYSGGVLAQVRTTDTTESTGGADTIFGNQGNDLILGGVNGSPDVIHGNEGADIIVGDDGEFLYDDAIDPGLTTLDIVRSVRTDRGGKDVIYGDGANDIILGATGGDEIHGGTEDDLVLGDFGEIRFLNNVARFAETTNLGQGSGDTIYGDAGEDVLLGGDVGDNIDGGSGNDLIFGDNVRLDRWGANYTDYTNPRFRTLNGTVIYNTNDNPMVNSTARNNPKGNPVWANWDIDMVYGFNVYGSDYLAGGAGNDMIFGQMGDDTIQGDGSIFSKVINDKPVAATRDGSLFGNDIIMVGTLQVRPSFEDPSDGDDYIEGNGGKDVIFGNLGQDDIIGGSSKLFSLQDPADAVKDRALRPDGSDWIFGGAGTEILRNEQGNVIDEGDDSHGRDSDMVLGDNGNILRLVTANGTTSYAAFNYDDIYTNGPQIIPRAAELLDYHIGGPDYLPNAGTIGNDIGAADEIHGESGDDFIYGMKGDDILFGEGQDDDIIGGYGNDWISGGTGQDGVIGDDGRIYTSRNGTAEPLYGISATTQSFISTPGNVQQADLNVTGQLKKAVNVTPFSQDPNWQATADEFNGVSKHTSDDIIYGGLGGDFLHGGSGDDAISGAEALPEFYANPVNLGNVLGYDPTTGEFATYDEYLPRTKIPGFLLNFNTDEGPTVTSATYGTVNTDGDDKIFGDLGNDWLVGGTGRDNLYGGWGDDLLNADDNQDTTGGTNDGPDTHPSYEDRAYGGAGRDVLIGNTGGDRLIDWVGEFNSFIVPFAPFGLGTVSRTLQPQLAEFLYALSASDGADFTRTADTGGDSARNGEPWGELGVVRQQDFAWHDQTGGPRDPQAGNLPGGKRDVLRSASFDDPTAPLSGFAPDSGKWAVSAGVLEVSADSPNSDAVSVYQIGDALPSYFEVLASMKVIKPTGGWKADSYIIFDYNSKSDFKFAGIDVSTNKLVMGHRDATGWHVDKQTNVQVKPDIFYNVMLSVNGLNATITVDNKTSLTYTFSPRVIDGYSYGLNWGLLAVGSDNSRGAFDNIRVQVVQPEATFTSTEDFSDSVADLFTGGSTGTWGVSGDRYNASPITPASVSLMDLGPDHLSVDALLDMSAKVNTQGRAGFVFDRYSADDFKFVAIDAATDQVIIGHYTKKTGWVNDAVVSKVINTGVDYTLGLSLKGSTVSVTLNGQAVVGYAYNAVTVDGHFGLMASVGTASFDDVTVKTTDRALASTPGSPMIASTTESLALADQGATVTTSDLDPIITAAIMQWAETLGNGDPRLALLGDVHVSVSDLARGELGYAEGNRILIDTDAAGHGWFIDSTPYDNSEFSPQGKDGELVAMGSSPAIGDMDLLTVVMHELGHVMGFEDLNPETNLLMSGTLDTGERHLVGETNSQDQAGTSKLVMMDSAEVAIPTLMEQPQRRWLADFLVNGFQDSYNNPNREIQIKMFGEDKEDTNSILRRMYGKRTRP